MEENKTEKIKKQNQFSFGKMCHGVAFFILFALLLSLVLFAVAKYQSEKDILVAIEMPDGELTKGSVLVLHFGSGVLKKSVEDGLSVSPKINFSTNWKNNRTLELKIGEYPLLGTEYLVLVGKFKTIWLVTQSEFEAKFSGPNFPEILSVFPEDGRENVELNEKISFEFKQALSKDFLLQVTVDPLDEFNYDLDQERKKLQLVSSKPFPKNTQYRLKLTAKHKFLENQSKELYRGGFKTKPPLPVVYWFSAAGKSLKEEQRKEEIIPSISEGKSIEVDLSSQSLFIFENGNELGAYKVSTGISGMDTPQGTFKVIARARRPWSEKYKLYMPWFIQFTNEGHGIHELPEWPGGLKEGASHLGIPVSHGCVRLGVGPAKIVYDFAEPGTAIVIRK